jgi:hypothetical protein
MLLMSSSFVSMYEMESSGAIDVARAARGWKVLCGKTDPLWREWQFRMRCPIFPQWKQGPMVSESCAVAPSELA